MSDPITSGKTLGIRECGCDESDSTCPNCSTSLSIPNSLLGQNVVCPKCGNEYYADPPLTPVSLESLEQFPIFIPPDRLPFLKSNRQKLLIQRLEQLMEAGNGKISKLAEEELNKDAIALGLDPSEGTSLLHSRFMAEFEAVRRRIENSLCMSDDDHAEIERLKYKYHTELNWDDGHRFRAIYLMEKERKPPPPIFTNLMLDEDEFAYLSATTVWLQTRTQTRGVSGASISIPIEGISFTFGSYQPIQTEDITPLSGGTLLVTSERLLFKGERQSTSIALNMIIDGCVYKDSLRIDKSSGKPDFFSMTSVQARYILALIGVLRTGRS